MQTEHSLRATPTTRSGKRAAYFSRGRDLDIMPPAKYRGIGKYTAELNDRYRPELDQMRRMLANGEIASVLAYSFHQNGTRYQGQLQYRSSDEINDKPAFLYDLAQDLLDHGTSEINLHPAFAVHAASPNLVVDVVFRNDGKREVVIDGPEQWLRKRVYLNGQYVEVHAFDSAGVGFKIALVEQYLRAASRPYAATISVKPAQSVRIEFVVPYTELVFDPGSSEPQVHAGTYRIGGTANLNIQSPAEMKGKVSTRMDTLPAVALTEP
ncbi:hypothetical protein [Burkholderia anthina]|uniref:hypothetical protein n=1 Tax=Burkholderia anthina TaxID=179879 RepID=UPI0037C194F0